MGSDSLNVAALIPARAGSKGVHKKNLHPLKGQPLIVHSILAAKRCPLINDVFVSTESEEIADLSKKWGAKIIERPFELAQDDSPIEEVTLHTLRTLSELPEHLVLLQPTSPLRTESHLNEALSEYFRQGANSMMSVSEVQHHPYKALTIEDGVLNPLFDQDSLSRPRQELPKTVRQNGAIYIVPTASFLRTKSFYIEPVAPFWMDEKSSVDIDTPEDLRYCEWLLSQD